MLLFRQPCVQFGLQATRPIKDYPRNTEVVQPGVLQPGLLQRGLLQPEVLQKAVLQPISDPVEVANRFCSYFSSIGPNLAKKIQPPLVHIKIFYLDHFKNQSFLAQQQRMKLLPLLNPLLPGKRLDTIIFQCL